jgi:hypothetical protein
MDEAITLEGFDPPKKRHSQDRNLVDLGGWLHAPVDWTGGPALEKAWRRRHGQSRLGVGLAVAHSTRRRLLLTNVPEDRDFLRSELEELIAEVVASPTGDARENGS